MKKIRYSNLFILGIFIYIIFHLISSIIGKSIQTTVLENEESTMKISKKCLIVRDEYLLKSDTDGTLKLLVDNGEKVTKSQDIANVYSDIDYTIDDKINNLDEEIGKIKNGEINISKDDISDFNSKIESTSNKIQSELLDKNYNNIKEYKENLVNYVNDKNKLLNNGIDTVKLATKEEQKEILEYQRENNVSTYKSDIGGIVSYTYDGKEEIYTYDNLDEITKSDIEKEDNEYKKISSNLDEVKDASIILRIINNYEAYVVASIEKEEIEYFEEGQTIKLVSNDTEIDGIVSDIIDEKNNFMVIFKINNQNKVIYDTRVKEFDIIYKQVQGLKIPKSAIKIVDNKEGVYVVNEQHKKADFIELKGTTYEDNDYKYINYYDNKINDIDTVDLYDEIILKPNIINTKMKIE